MSEKEFPQGDRVTIRARNVNVSSGGVAGIDRSKGKMMGGDAMDIVTPAGFLTNAVKRLPILWWAIGVGAILAIVAIVSYWKVPTAGLVLGGIGLFVGMFGLLIFAALVNPPSKGVKPPVISQVVLWAFGLLMIFAGFLTASSFFFDTPIPLRTKFFPPAATNTRTTSHNTTTG